MTQHKTIKMRRTTAPKTQPSIIANLLLLSSSAETNQNKLLAPNIFLDVEPLLPNPIDRESVTDSRVFAAFFEEYYISCLSVNQVITNTLKLN